MTRRSLGTADAVRRTLVLGPAAVLLAACADRTPTAVPGDLLAVTSGRGTLLPSGRYLVGLAPNATLTPAQLAAARATVVETVPAVGLVEVNAANPTALRTIPGVRYVEPSFEFALEVQEGTGDVPAATPDAEAPTSTSAPWFASGIQWNMTAVQAPAGWAATTGGAGANACIIDSGIDETHQEIAGKVVARTSFVPGTSPAPLDSNGHGTHVAGTVTANGIVTAGVAPAANLMAAKVFAATGGTPVARVVNALRWCADNGAHTVNMSIGGIRYYPPTPITNEPSYAAYADGVKYATDRGVVVVVSAGNSNIRLDNTKLVVVPAQVPGTIIVGATGPLSRTGAWSVDGAVRTLPLSAIATPVKWDPYDMEQVWQGVDGKAFYSNFGTGVQVFAPGGRGGVPSGFINRIVADANGVRQQQTGSLYDNVMAACSRFATYTAIQNAGGNATLAGGNCRAANRTDRYASLAGTSMAAPHVTGIATLLYAELGGERTVANRTKIETCIRTSTDNVGPNTTFGGGRVNVQKALACVRS